jgi:hypothetical protein
VRVELNGDLTLIATLDALAAIATDAAGNLYVAKPGGTTAHFGYFAADANGSVGPTPTFWPLAQGTTVGAEYVDQSLTRFSSPYDVFAAAHVWVAEYGLSAVRIIW